MRVGTERNRPNYLAYVLLIGGGVIVAFPFLWMASTALRDHQYVIENPPRLIPPEPTVANFVEAWTANNFQLYFANSLFVAVATTILSTLLSAMVAYAFARFEFRGKTVTFYGMLLMLMVPALVMIIPQFVLVRNLGLRNSLWGLIVVYVATSMALNTFLLRGFLEGLPRETEEAMRVDGAGWGTIFWRMVIPLSRPALATVAIFTFLGAWDEYVWALTAIDIEAKRTLPVAIASFQGQHATEWGLVFAASLIAAIPVIAVFIAMQKQFVSGLTGGSIKG